MRVSFTAYNLFYKPCPPYAIKIRCTACGVVIVTRKPMAEKLQACPKCKASPFSYSAV